MGIARRFGGSSLFLLVTTGFLNLAMVVFHRAMSSGLAEDYGQLATLIGLVNVVTGLTAGLGVWITRRVAGDVAAGGLASARGRLLRLAPRFALGLVGAGAVVAAAGPLVVDFFHIASWGLYALAVATVVSLLAETVVRGATQGAQRFGQLGWSMVAEGVGRAGIAWLLVAAGAGIAGGLLGWVVGGVFGLVVCLPGLLGPAASPPPDPRTGLHDVARLASDTGCTALYVVMCNLDLFAVQHVFPDAEAALYARASLVAKTLLFAPVALVTVLLPRVADARARGEDPLPLLATALKWTAGLLLAAFVVVVAFTDNVILLLCGEDPIFQSIGSLVHMFTLAVMPLAAWQVVLYYQLARGDRRPIVLPALTVAAYAVALVFFHDTFDEVVACLATAGLVALAGGLALSLRGNP